MTTLEALVYLLSVGSVPFALSSSRWLRANPWRRALAALPLALLGINVQFGDRPWLAGGLAALILMAAALRPPSLRWAALLVLAIAGEFWFRPGVVTLAGRQFFTPHATQILLVAGGYLATVVVGGVLVEEVIKRVKGLPRSSAEAELPGGAPSGGAVIGVLERTLVYGAVLLGHPEAVALVVAMKSVARFPEFTRDRRFAEYFLIGSLLSLLVALAAGYLIRAALAQLN